MPLVPERRVEPAERQREPVPERRDRGQVEAVEANFDVDALGPELLDALARAGTPEVRIEAVAVPVAMALDLVPSNVDPSAVRKYLETQPGVTAVHDLHIWSLSTTETALSAHLVKPNAEIDDATIARVCRELQQHFAIGHATIQLESGDAAHPCRHEPDRVI